MKFGKIIKSLLYLSIFVGNMDAYAQEGVVVDMELLREQLSNYDFDNSYPAKTKKEVKKLKGYEETCEDKGYFCKTGELCVKNEDTNICVSPKDLNKSTDESLVKIPFDDEYCQNRHYPNGTNCKCERDKIRIDVEAGYGIPVGRRNPISDLVYIACCNKNEIAVIEKSLRGVALGAICCPLGFTTVINGSCSRCANNEVIVNTGTAGYTCCPKDKPYWSTIIGACVACPNLWKDGTCHKCPEDKPMFDNEKGVCINPGLFGSCNTIGYGRTCGPELCCATHQKCNARYDISDENFGKKIYQCVQDPNKNDPRIALSEGYYSSEEYLASSDSWEYNMSEESFYSADTNSDYNYENVVSSEAIASAHYDYKYSNKNNYSDYPYSNYSDYANSNYSAYSQEMSS